MRKLFAFAITIALAGLPVLVASPTVQAANSGE